MNVSRSLLLGGSNRLRHLLLACSAFGAGLLQASCTGELHGGHPSDGAAPFAGMASNSGGAGPISGGSATGGAAAPAADSAGTAGDLGPTTTSPYAEAVLCPAPQAPSSSELSPGFAVSCAGCHGDKGQGKTSQTGGIYPSLQDSAKKLSLSEFTNVVRNGRPSTLMPAFAESAVSAQQIMRDFDALRGAAVTSSADPDCGPGSLELPHASAAEVEASITAGMAAFRKQGEKGACAGCHSAAAFDLAAIGYSDAAILRRAVDANHLTPEDGQAVVNLVHALRVRYDIQRPLHPMRFRFMQPGGEPLQPVAQTKFDGGAYGIDAPALDRAFALSLQNDTKLLLVASTIDSLEKAKAVQDQVMKLDYTQLPTGIPIEHWTEDAFHGPEHNIPNEWIPMLTRNPAPGHESDWFARVDAYRADPSDANLWPMFDAIDTLTVGDHPGDEYKNATKWSHDKYLSVQVASHMLIHRTLKQPDPLAGMTPPTDAKARRDMVIAHNPFWIAGDTVRKAPLDAPGVDGLMAFPPNLDLTINKGQPGQETPDVGRLMMTRNDMLSWFWLGFMNDPALLIQENSIATLDTDYFNSNLVYQGYNVHSAFVVAVAMLHKANAPAEYMMMHAVATEGTGIWASPRPFLVFKQNERDLHFLAPGDTRAPIHAKLWANTFRAAFYLMNDELARTNKVFDRARTLLNVNFMHRWFATGMLEKGEDHTALDKLVDELRGRIQSADQIGEVTVYDTKISGGDDALDPVVLCQSDGDWNRSLGTCSSWGTNY